MPNTIYEALPFRATPNRAHIVSHIMRSLCSNELLFGDDGPCEDRCFECERCVGALAKSSRLLATPGAIVLEIWKLDGDLPAGVVVVLPVSATEATVHFTFFDGRLSDKREVLQAISEWLFASSRLQRLTAEIPDYAFSLARFVNRHLGFGGGFKFKHRQNVIEVEGVRKSATRWRGSNRDVLVLGKVR